MIAPKEYRRSGATVNRYIATLSHVFSFALKDRRLIDRNPVGDIRLKKESSGRTRFLSDELLSPEWADVDLKAGRATIHDTKNHLVVDHKAKVIERMVAAKGL